MNYDAIKKAAEGYKADMVKFLRDMIAIPSESCEEEGVVKRIAAEMEKLGYDKVEFDKLGNVIGWMGTGDKIIAIDSHIDTVGIGNLSNWEADPYEGYETEDVIYGRGGSDQEGGMASFWSVLFKATGFADLLSRMDFINEIVEHDQSVIDQLRTLRQQLAQDKADLEQQQAELTASKTELDAQVAEAIDAMLTSQGPYLLICDVDPMATT